MHPPARPYCPSRPSARCYHAYFECILSFPSATLPKQSSKRVSHPSRKVREKETRNSIGSRLCRSFALLHLICVHTHTLTHTKILMYITVGAVIRDHKAIRVEENAFIYTHGPQNVIMYISDRDALSDSSDTKVNEINSV